MLNKKNLVFFSFCPLCCVNKSLSLPASEGRRGGVDAFFPFFFLCYLSPSGGQSAPGNMPPSSVSGCCFASAVAYLL